MDIEKLNWLLFTSYMSGVTSAAWIIVLIRDYMKKQKCAHKNTHTYVESVAATCEKITITCLDCGKKTTKTEC